MIFGLKLWTRVEQWSISILADAGKLQEVKEVMNKDEIEVLELSKTRWNGFCEITQ